MIKTITRLVVCLLIMVTTAETLKAQDIHFSQFYSAPLILNPALTGHINGSGRATATFRSQYASLAPYTTIAASYDMSLLGCQLKNDHLGVGIALFNDRSGDGNFNNLTGMLSAAFHKGLDQDGRFLVSIGGQAAYTQKSVDFTRLLFESQIFDYEFDPTLANGESVYNNSFSFFDFRAGLLLTAAVSERVNFYGGGSYHHLTQHAETFLVSDVTEDPDILKLPSRLVIHGGGSFFLADALSISPSGLYQQQGTSREIVYGAALGFHFSQNNRYRRSEAGSGSGLYLGAWNRWAGTEPDAIMISLGVDYNDIKFGFSYDINISQLKTVTQSQGAVEISLIYGFKTSECNRRDPLYCPRF